MRFKPRQSSPRLRSFDYSGSHAYHLTFTTQGRVPRFRDGGLIQSCLESLSTSAPRYGVTIIAYCFMPDHLHLLVAGSETTSLIRFAQHFKQAIGHRHPRLWQRSYYDHILRLEEDLDDVANYIWANPVRAGFVTDVTEYPYSGPRGAMVTGEAEDRAEALSLQSLSHQ